MMTGKLTTHVLDTAQGIPAAKMEIELWLLTDERTLLKTVRTNQDGRTDEPLLIDADFKPERYELVFYAGDYFRAVYPDLPEPLFLDRIPIQFGIANPNVHYHVPLLASPWSYSTYRGS